MQRKIKKIFMYTKVLWKLGFFNISRKLSNVYCFIVAWNLSIFTILNVFLKQDKTNFQKYSWDCDESIYHFVCIEKDTYYGF